MKKSVLITALILLVSSSLLRAEPQEVFARSFMLTRPASYNIAMNQQLWHNFVYHKSGPVYGAFQLIPFYQASRDRAKVARYFLPNRKNELLVAGDTTSSNLIRSRDIRAEWLGLATNFSGKFSICPEQTQIGFTVMYNQDMRNFFDIEFMKNWSFGVEIPVIMVENNLNLCQFDLQTTTTETGVQPDIISALNQTDWKYGKWSSKAQSLMRPANIKFTLGRSLMHRDFFQLATDLSLSIPIADHQDAEYLFSPVVGLDRHVGLGGAVYMQLLLNCNPEKFAWTFYLNLEGTFFVRNKQHRTYDLKDKPFSRYMQYTRRNSAPGVTIPGINVLTLPSLVRPYGVADFSFGWRINTAPFEFEIGYDLYGFGGEDVKLRADFDSPFNRACGGENEIGIAGAGTIDFKGTAIQATASESTIDCRATDDSSFVAIQENDIDLCTAAAGSVLNHKFHAAIGIEHLGETMGGFGGFGFYFEFPQKNSNLANWGAWFKVGATF